MMYNVGIKEVKMKFTKKEISLCRQIAEKYKRKIEYGDWYINFDEEVRLKEFFGVGYREEDCFSLWTISDCLEFLREKMWHIVALTDDAVFDEKFQYHCEITDDKFDKTIYKKGKTPLEACLKAVLDVLEEGE